MRIIGDSRVLYNALTALLLFTFTTDCSIRDYWSILKKLSSLLTSYAGITLYSRGMSRWFLDLVVRYCCSGLGVQPPATDKFWIWNLLDSLHSISLFQCYTWFYHLKFSKIECKCFCLKKWWIHYFVDAHPQPIFSWLWVRAWFKTMLR